MLYTFLWHWENEQLIECTVRHWNTLLQIWLWSQHSPPIIFSRNYIHLLKSENRKSSICKIIQIQIIPRFWVNKIKQIYLTEKEDRPRRHEHLWLLQHTIAAALLIRYILAPSAAPPLTWIRVWAENPPLCACIWKANLRESPDPVLQRSSAGHVCKQLKSGDEQDQVLSRHCVCNPAQIDFCIIKSKSKTLLEQGLVVMKLW